MSEEEASVYVILVLAVVAIIGLGLSVASLATDQSMWGMMGGGGGMMNGGGGSTTTASHPGAFEWVILILSIALVAVALLLLVWGRGRSAPATAAIPQTPMPPAPPAMAAASAVPSAPAATPSATLAAAPVPEPALVKLLDEDERRMYLELRGHGGEMLQRDLVALGIFSKAKVTRVLDKLEAKGIVVREAHGMTNRVRLTGGVSR